MSAGAELANVLNEAALETVRRRGERVSRADIYNGMDRILQVQVQSLSLEHSMTAPYLICHTASVRFVGCHGGDA